MTSNDQDIATARSTIDVVFILLALQSGIGLLSAVSGLILGVAMGAPLLLVWTLLVGCGVPLAVCLCAFGIERGSRRARHLLLAFELLTSAGTALRWLFGLLPASAPLALATGIGLPLLVFVLLETPAVRHFFRKPVRSSIAPPTAPATTGAILFPTAYLRQTR